MEITIELQPVDKKKKPIRKSLCIKKEQIKISSTEIQGPTSPNGLNFLKDGEKKLSRAKLKIKEILSNQD